MTSTIAEPSLFRWLEVKPDQRGEFAQNFERRPFVLRHRLAEHPLFQMASLMSLIRKTAHNPERLYYNTGDASVGGGWDFQANRDFPAEVAFERIQTANAWMILKSVQAEPEYRELLDSFLEEVYRASAHDIAETCNHVMSIIITSPQRVTPYHIDGESNYLLQLSGTKMVYVFDGRNRKIVSEEQLERFWSGDLNAATYEESFQAEAWPFQLAPGEAVHVPTTFPHWVKNGDSVSISVSLNLQFKDQRVPRLYRLNHSLRQRGLKPHAPGESRVGDLAKLAGLRLKELARPSR